MSVTFWAEAEIATKAEAAKTSFANVFMFLLSGEILAESLRYLIVKYE